MQRFAKHRHVAVGGIGEHRRDGQPRGPRAAHQRQRQAPLLLKVDGRRNTDAGAPRAIARPLLRQVQGGAQHPGPPLGPQQRRRGHLAIGDLAHRAAILPRHADRVLALFRKARVVDHEHPFAHRQQLQHPAPHGLPIPRGVRDEMLKRLIVPRIGHPRQHRVHRFARAVAQQPLQIAAQGRVLQAGTEAVLELLEIPQQPAYARPCALIEHRRSAYRTSRIRTMSSIQITDGFPRESCEVTK